VGQIVSARGVAITKVVVPLHHVSSWSMVVCSCGGSLVGGAQSIVPIISEVCFPDITVSD